MESLGLQEARLEAVKPLPAPGTKRRALFEREEVRGEGATPIAFRAVTGSLICDCRNRPGALCVVKEVARTTSAPPEADKLDAIRLVKYWWAARHDLLEPRVPKEV